MVSALSGGLKVLLSESTPGFLRKSESSHFLFPFHPSRGACRGRPPLGEGRLRPLFPKFQRQNARSVHMTLASHGKLPAALMIQESPEDGADHLCD